MLFTHVAFDVVILQLMSGQPYFSLS